MADLFIGDCLELLPLIAEGIDAVITDPPYGISLKTAYKSRKRGRLAESNDFPAIIGDDEPFDPTPWLAFERVVLFGANWYCQRLPHSGAWIVWDKLDGLESKRPFGFNDNSDCELIWTNKGKAARIIRHRWMGAMKGSEHREKRVHPTQKPIALLRTIVLNYTEYGDTILDPYMGSGSTGVACIQTGRKFVGVEIDPHYYKSAVRRIEKAEKLEQQRESIPF